MDFSLCRIALSRILSMLMKGAKTFCSWGDDWIGAVVEGTRAVSPAWMRRVYASSCDRGVLSTTGGTLGPIVLW